LPQAILEAIYSAQDEMREVASRQPRLERMGSTIALGVIAGRTLYLAHVGDSRVYLIRRGEIIQLTKDHTFVQALQDAGCLTSEEAKNHRWRHVITESVNASRQSRVEVEAHPLLPGDRLLFATDGLTDVVDDETLGSIISRTDDPQTAANELVRHCLDKDTSDNITCLVVHVDPWRF
jgi:protein phosphatase